MFGQQSVQCLIRCQNYFLLSPWLFVCTYCKYGAKKQEVEEDEKQLTRYRELYAILTEPGSDDQTSQMPYDELSEWCAGEMEPVFSDRDVLYVQTLHYVHTLAMQNKRWEAAVTYGETILPAFR